MNPNDQPTDPSQQRHQPKPGAQDEKPVLPADANTGIPTLPSPMAQELHHPKQGGQAPESSTSQAQRQPQEPPAPPAPPQHQAQTQQQRPEPTSQVPATEPTPPSFYRPDDAQARYDAAPELIPAELQMQDNGRQVSWTAMEFIEHDKSPAWYLTMVGISVGAMGLMYIITRDFFNVGIVAIAAVLFGIVAGRPPRHLEYLVNDQGVGIGRRFYTYTDFRSFSIAEEGLARSIVLMPLKRFMPPLSLYFDPSDEERIGDVLVSHLPFAEHQQQLTEKLMRRIHF